MPKILITGASGLIGTRLQEILADRNYEVYTLGRSTTTHRPGVRSFIWDINKQSIDIKALEGVDAIIHLAGAGVADKRWTASRKKEILDSRIESTRLLYDTLKNNPHQVKTIISSSAVGYYGDCGEEIIKESHAPGNDFLADVCRQWEKSVAGFDKIGLRHICCRIGVVLAKNGGALPQLTKTLPIGVAGYFAKEPLYYPWIHLDDVCGIMIHALENSNLRGSYNTTAPGPIPIRDLMSAIIAAKKSKAILTPIPTLALKIAVGEMAEMLLCSQRCSAEKIIEAGYKFRFSDIVTALKDIYK